MLVNQSLDRPVLCSRSAAVTRTSTPRTAAIAPVAEEGGGWKEEEEGGVEWEGRRGQLERDRSRARVCKRGVGGRVWKTTRTPPPHTAKPPHPRPRPHPNPTTTR